MYKNITEKINLFQNIFPLYIPQRYKTLSTFKKENKKTMDQVVSLIPKKLVLKLLRLIQ